MKVTPGLLISMCERNTQRANTHRWRHSERKETASSRGIIFNSNNLKQKRVSTKQFPALLCFGRAGREKLHISQIVQILECSRTHMHRKNPEHRDSQMLLRNLELKRGLLGHTVLSFVAGDTVSYSTACQWGPPNMVDKKLNSILKWAELICHWLYLEDCYRATLPSLLGTSFQFSVSFYPGVVCIHLLTCQHCRLTPIGLKKRK